jgi:NAD(P) transhydrogenase subunit alpha
MEIAPHRAKEPLAHLMAALIIGALAETARGERRVALDPEAVARLVSAGKGVMIETGAGIAASFSDAAFTASGATVSSRAKVIAGADVLAVIRYPEVAVTSKLRSGQALLGLLDPLNRLVEMTELAAAGVTAIAFELLPRTVSRAQSMDALSSQSSAAGYRAGIVAANAFGRYLPMMITASGTAKPAKVIVIGTGVAGLQAIATTKRLGAVVTGYDVRAASRGEVESLGAQFLTSSVAEGAAAGGYARALTADERAIQEKELATALLGFDIIITTAKVPGHTPPILVSAATLAALRPGTVCVDLGSSDRGGNVAGSVEATTTVSAEGVTVIGAGELAADLPTSSSQMYGRNVVSVIASLAPQDSIEIDPADDVHSGIVVSHAGEIVNARVRSALKLEPLTPTTALQGAPA